MKNKLFEGSAIIILTGALHYFEKYVYNDWNFLGFVLTLIMLDTIMGFLANWYTKSLSSMGWRQLFKKFIEYGTCLVICHVLTSFEIQGVPSGVMDWADNFLYAAMLVAESMSIGENWLKMNKKGGLMKKLLSRLSQFDIQNAKNINESDNAEINQNS
ncbi:MAG: hypothetical protein EOP53_02320 [Sphingobacteriales bacterium]|nr:MAG: hypothetical protein EOP53_02320 [Sphingobacteriales bacterium]